MIGNSFRDNDLKSAKIYNGSDGSLIKEYNTSVLLPFDKFANSFIAERYAQPLRAYGAKKYGFELFLQKKTIFHLVRISLSMFNNLVDERIKRSTFNITDMFVSPYRECRLIAQDSSKPWLVNSTRFNFWYACESRGSQFLDKELKDKTDLIRLETKSSDVLDLDLATFILAQQYSTAGNIKEPICGTPEVPIGTELLIIHHNSKYSYKCAQGFKEINGSRNGPYDLTCSIDMKWKGSFPICVPERTCKKFELTDKHAIEVFSYEKVYYLNESIWFAIEGTKVHFRCKIETQIFIGKEYRICGKDGQWSDTLPNCLDTESGLLKGSNYFVVFELITCFLLRDGNDWIYINFNYYSDNYFRHLCFDRYSRLLWLQMEENALK